MDPRMLNMAPTLLSGREMDTQMLVEMSRKSREKRLYEEKVSTENCFKACSTVEGKWRNGTPA